MLPQEPHMEDPVAERADPSGRYLHGHDEAVLNAHADRGAADSAAYLLPHLRPGMRLLDVGFGPGTITLDLAAAVAPGEVIGVENTTEPFETARANAERRGDTRTRFVPGDVMSLPFADASFDVVHAHQVLQHLTDPVGALREMRRVCRPGGLVAVRDADYAAMSWYPELPALDEWRALYRTMANALQAEPDAGRYLRAWTAEAGFTEVTISSSNWCYATPEATRRWGESQARRVTGPTFTHQATQHGITDEQVDAIGRAWRQWGADPHAFFLIPNTEVLARA